MFASQFERGTEISGPGENGHFCFVTVFNYMPLFVAAIFTNSAYPIPPLKITQVE